MITEHIAQEIGLDQWEDDEDYEQIDFDFNIEDLGDTRDGDSIFGNPDDISTIGDKSATSIRTTQSTRDALLASQSNIRKQEEQLQLKDNEIKAQQ